MVQTMRYESTDIIITETQSKILNELAKHDHIDRDPLSRNIGIPRTTCENNLVKLKKHNLVEKFQDDNPGKRGRPRVYWRLVKKW